MPAHTRGVIILIAGLWLSPASAQPYKCVDPQGQVTYSQVRCPDNPQPLALRPTRPEVTNADCRLLSAFAGEVAVAMRDGLDAEGLYERFGGLDHLSRGANQVISYVHQFHSQPNLSVARIRGLARRQCRSGYFGGLQCRDFPQAFTDDLGGCDPHTGKPRSKRGYIKTKKRSAKGTPEHKRVEPNAEETTHCRIKLRARLKAIDEKLREGYSAREGERLRDQRRDLQGRLLRCEDEA